MAVTFGKIGIFRVMGKNYLDGFDIRKASRRKSRKLGRPGIAG